MQLSAVLALGLGLLLCGLNYGHSSVHVVGLSWMYYGHSSVHVVPIASGLLGCALAHSYIPSAGTHHNMMMQQQQQQHIIILILRKYLKSEVTSSQLYVSTLLSFSPSSTRWLLYRLSPAAHHPSLHHMQPGWPREWQLHCHSMP